MQASPTSKLKTTSDSMRDSLAEKEQKLRYFIKNLGRVLVAYSGGVDSSVVAKIASEVTTARAVIARSPSLPERDYNAALDLAKEHNITLHTIYTQELANNDYKANTPNRCYHCKNELYSTLQNHLKTKDYDAILDGSNLDDNKDYRPGRKAAIELNVQSPLLEIGFTKQDVRALALKLNLPNHDKPAAPCLASRIPYGISVTTTALRKIEIAEDFLKTRFQLKVLRVRYHNNLARIEVPRKDITTLLENSTEIHKKFKSFGFLYVTIDLAGFRSGSLNEVFNNSKS
ncbi:hypothetical protein COTS27_00929 [Spirochaetota bacterium]|nr:hypothetical protein COTS27_00929 [Spirochaetota bacterium]